MRRRSRAALRKPSEHAVEPATRGVVAAKRGELGLASVADARFPAALHFCCCTCSAAACDTLGQILAQQRVRFAEQDIGRSARTALRPPASARPISPSCRSPSKLLKLMRSCTAFGIGMKLRRRAECDLSRGMSPRLHRPPHPCAARACRRYDDAEKSRKPRAAARAFDFDRRAFLACDRAGKSSEISREEACLVVVESIFVLDIADDFAVPGT